MLGRSGLPVHRLTLAGLGQQVAGLVQHLGQGGDAGGRRRQVAGWKFRRQHVVAGYVADFYCPALRLILEVDGGVHADRAAEDAVRTADLEALGITVRRIPNEAILAHLPAVLTALRTTCARLSAPLSPGNRGKGAGG